MEIAGYRLNEPEKIDTPALLVYEEKVKHNIDEVIRVCGSAERVVPHVKTHKSAEVLALQMEAGMTSYKCATLREAELLAEHGASEIIIAYPMLHPAKIKRLANLMRLYPESEFRAIASTHGAPWRRSPRWQRKRGARWGSTWTWTPACTGRACSRGRRPGTSTPAWRPHRD